MTFAYTRISTHGQNGDNQKHEILDFANTKSLGKLNFVSEVVSGTVSWKNRELGDLVEKMKKDDILVVSELSRLGRSMLEIMEVLSILLRKKIKVFSVKGQYELGDNIQSKVLAFAFGLASEIERELISSRTKEALARIKSEGRKLGRPKGPGKSKLDIHLEEIKKLRAKKVSLTALARIFDVSPAMMWKYSKSRGIS